MKTKSLLALIFCCLFFVSTYAADRDAELRDEMWNSKDKDFKVTQIPSKWDHESAVIIAQLTRFEYKKAVMLRNLYYNTYNHFRVKLMDKKAIEEYNELSFYVSRPDFKVYVGAKLIKPNGTEVIIDLSKAVKMERNAGGQSISYKKLAIPNLEPGDILDYYICEEETIYIGGANFHFFEPVIHNLPQDYPLMKQKLQFLVQRKCYINLRSFNGAPELKLVTDKEKDEQYYSLEDSDREGLKDVRWLYPNRELPSVKFRATYTVGNNPFDGLIGEQGEAKSSASASEIYKFSSAIMNQLPSAKDFTKYMKKYHPAVTDPMEIAKLAYYYMRHDILSANEKNLLDNEGPFYKQDIYFIQEFSKLLDSRQIANDLIIGAPRNISAIEDLLLERELDYMVRVKGKDNQYMYFTTPSIFSTVGVLPSRYEGIEAYAYPNKDRSKSTKIKLPAMGSDVNTSETVLNVKINDMVSSDVSVKETLNGINKTTGQFEFLDAFDAIYEDEKAFDPIESFEYTSSSGRKKYAIMREEYLAKREKIRIDALKESLKNQYSFETKDPANFKVEQTGRLDKNPQMIYSYTFKSDDLIKKSGPNYLMDVGKLIGGQVKVEKEELERDYNIYFDFARSFRCRIAIEIPTGYEVQGIDKLNQKIEGKSGGFSSTAKIEEGKIVIETFKHYDVNFVTKDQWLATVDFLNAANAFTEQKLLFKKK